MRPPRLLLGAALLFWGWQTDLLWLGSMAAIVIEAPAFLKTRFTFSQADLDRVWNLCVGLFLAATIYAFLSSDNVDAVTNLLKEHSPSSRLATLNQSKRSLFQLLQWLPLMFLPMLLAQVYGAQERLDWSTFSWWLRRQRNHPGYSARYAFGFHIGYPYFACCLFSASAANQRAVWFVVGFVTLAGWALWANRSPSSAAPAWALSFVLALALGTGVQFGLLQVQKLVQRLDEVLLSRWSGGRSWDPTRNQARLGAVGRLKLSGKIVFRLESKDQPPPELLREATYTLFREQTWAAGAPQFEHVTPEANLSTWILRSTFGNTRHVRIDGFFPGGAGLVPLPSGAVRLDQLPATGLTTNALGSVQVEDAPGFAQWDTSYAASGSIDRPPNVEDLVIYSQERPALRRIVDELHLDGLPAGERVHAIERFFAQHFSYSLWQGPEHRGTTNPTPIARFLLENRRGHCEYFATATVLLLRQAGIPARYAVGFSVQEKSGDYYLVRERHAHAWCLAWIDDAWREVDTTPPIWKADDYTRASLWEPVRDLFSRIWFEFSRWRWGHAEWKRYLLWLIVPLVVLMVVRLLSQRQWGRLNRSNTRSGADLDRPGRDSEFYLIERKLELAGLKRRPGETASSWLQRVGLAGVVPTEGLDALLASHYRLRFDPRGLSAAERNHFRQQAYAWLERADRP